MRKEETIHLEEIVRLRRIEGQVRGIQKMIKEKRYCIDVLTQISSVLGAIIKVEENILQKHLRGSVRESLKKGNREEKERKIEEMIQVLQRLRRY